jgi:hypothetical protein
MIKTADSKDGFFSIEVKGAAGFDMAASCRAPAPTCVFHLFVRSAHAARRRYS